MLSDFLFRAPVDHIVKLLVSQDVPTYMYVMNTTVEALRLPEWRKYPHNIEHYFLTGAPFMDTGTQLFASEAFLNNLILSCIKKPVFVIFRTRLTGSKFHNQVFLYLFNSYWKKCPKIDTFARQIWNLAMINKINLPEMVYWYFLQYKSYLSYVHTKSNHLHTAINCT